MARLLKLGLYPSKKHIRVQVYRKHTSIDEKGLAKFDYHSIGAFKLGSNDESLNPILQLLTPAERIELEAFLFSVDFAKHTFNENVMQLEREIVLLPQGLLAAAQALSLLAESHDITFNAHEVMTNALFQHLQKLEKQLSDKVGEPVQILAKYRAPQ